MQTQINELRRKVTFYRNLLLSRFAFENDADRDAYRARVREIYESIDVMQQRLLDIDMNNIQQVENIEARLRVFSRSILRRNEKLMEITNKIKLKVKIK